MTEVLIPLSSWQGLQAMAVVLLLALLLEAVFGDPDSIYRHIPHPLILMDFVVNWLDDQFLDGDTDEKAKRLAGGVVVMISMLVVLSIVATFSVLVAWLPIGTILIAILASTLFSYRDLFLKLIAVVLGMRRDMHGARIALEEFTGRDADGLNPSEIARAAAGHFAHKFATDFIGPVFWFLVFGLPGLAAYKLLFIIHLRFRSDPQHYDRYSWVGLTLFAWMQWPAFRLSGGLITLAAFIVPGPNGKHAFDALKHSLRQKDTASETWPRATMDAALQFTETAPDETDNADTSDTKDAPDTIASDADLVDGAQKTLQALLIGLATVALISTLAILAILI